MCRKTKLKVKTQTLLTSEPYNFFKYAREFDTFIKQNKELPTFQITYESLFHDTKSQVQRLADFLEVDCSEEKVVQVVEMCSFENMKKADGNFKENVIDEITGGVTSSIYRKGITCCFDDRRFVLHYQMLVVFI